MTSEKTREIAERALNGLAIVWLMVVGVATHSVLHHVLHAAPLVVVALLPQGTRAWLMRAMSAYLWLFMLAVMTPMIEEEILHGALLRGRGELQHWLAPTMALIACTWFATCVSLLARVRGAFLAAFVLIAAFTAGLARVQAVVGPLMTAPVERVIAGNFNAIAVVGLEAVLALLVPWGILLRVARIKPTFNARAVAMQAAFWGVFVLCMLVGLLADG